MEQELVELKRKFELIKNEKAIKDKEYNEIKWIKDSPESYINKRLEDINHQLNEKDREVSKLKDLLKNKGNYICD